MKEYLIVYSYVEGNCNFGSVFDNDKDCILAHIPNIDNEIIEANNKKDAMNEFLKYRDIDKYSILNIVELGDKENE